MPDTTIAGETRSLAQRLAEGPLPLAEGLHYAMELTEALRRIHECGNAHGALSPEVVILTDSGVQLAPGDYGVTPYTAPELLDGAERNARSDIFSFGAVFYEMLMGQRAFAGEGPALLEALLTAQPPSTGSLPVDRLVIGCTAKDPAQRWPRIQKVMLELKMLTVAARRAEGQPTTRPADSVELATLHASAERSESRLEAIEKVIADLRRSAAGSETTEVRLSSLRPSALAQTAQPSMEDFAAHLLERLDAQEMRIAELTSELAGSAPEILRAEALRVEMRLAARIDAQDRQIAELQRAAARPRIESEASAPETQSGDPILIARVQAQERAINELRNALTEATGLIPDTELLRSESRQSEARLAARIQAQERVLTELHQTAIAAAAAPDAEVLRAEFRQVETRMATRLQAQEKLAAEIQRAVVDTPGTNQQVESLRAEISQAEARLGARLQSQDGAIASLRSAAEHAPAPHPATATELDSLRADSRQLETRLTARIQTLDQTIAELRRAMAGGAAYSGDPADLGAIRAEARQIESRLSARIQAQDKTLSEVQRAASAAVDSLHAQVASIEKQLADAGDAALSLPAGNEGATPAVRAAATRIQSQIAAFREATTRLEHAVEALNRRTEDLEKNMAADLLDFENKLEAQEAAVQSTRSAMAQTDDLVERVVEALESLQTAVLDRPEERVPSDIS